MSRPEARLLFINRNPEARRKHLLWSNSQDLSPALLPPVHASPLTAVILEEWLSKLIKHKLSQPGVPNFNKQPKWF